jgi:hypothetical protein
VSCDPGCTHWRIVINAWETWTVAAADGVGCARVRWEINFLLTFETAPFFCVYPVSAPDEGQCLAVGRQPTKLPIVRVDSCLSPHTLHEVRYFLHASKYHDHYCFCTTETWRYNEVPETYSSLEGIPDIIKIQEYQQWKQKLHCGVHKVTSLSHGRIKDIAVTAATYPRRCKGPQTTRPSMKKYISEGLVD